MALFVLFSRHKRRVFTDSRINATPMMGMKKMGSKLFVGIVVLVGSVSGQGVEP